jgi:hypothetical protein
LTKSEGRVKVLAEAFMTRFLVGSSFQTVAHGILRPFLCLFSEDGTMSFEAQSGSGAWIHILSNQLRGTDWSESEEKASTCLGSLQPIQTIELDNYDLNVLKTHYRAVAPG